MRPEGCRARGRAPLTAARHQSPDCPARDDERRRRPLGCGATVAEPGTSCLERWTGKRTGRRGEIQLGTGGVQDRFLLRTARSPLCRPRSEPAGEEHRLAFSRLLWPVASAAASPPACGCSPAARPPPPPSAAGSRGPSAFLGRGAPAGAWNLTQWGGARALRIWGTPVAERLPPWAPTVGTLKLA